MDAPMTRLGPRFEAALGYAAAVHAMQRRKGPRRLPYIGHLLGVASFVIEDGGTEDEVIAALLHDAPEDQGGLERLADIRERFGDRVAQIVKACSDTFKDPKPPWRRRKEEYLAHLRGTEDTSVLRVAIADKVHNLTSTVADVRLEGQEVWERFNACASDQLWYYGELQIVFARLEASPRLVPELSRLLTELVSLVPASEENVPSEILDFINRRSSGRVAAVATSLARRLACRRDIELRTQKSKKEPWYFQVRTERFRQVLAYVNVSQTYVRVDYRLPKDHDTAGRAIPRSNFYGIGLRLANERDLDFAMELIDDALARPE